MMRMTLFASAMVATAMAGGCSSGQCSPFGLCNGQRVDIATFEECETAAAYIQNEASSQIELLNYIVGDTPQCTMALQHVLKAAKALTDKKSGGRYLQERALGGSGSGESSFCEFAEAFVQAELACAGFFNDLIHYETLQGKSCQPYISPEEFVKVCRTREVPPQPITAHVIDVDGPNLPDVQFISKLFEYFFFGIWCDLPCNSGCRVRFEGQQLKDFIRDQADLVSDARDIGTDAAALSAILRSLQYKLSILENKCQAEIYAATLAAPTTTGLIAKTAGVFASLNKQTTTPACCTLCQDVKVVTALDNELCHDIKDFIADLVDTVNDLPEICEGGCFGKTLASTNANNMQMSTVDFVGLFSSAQAQANSMKAQVSAQGFAAPRSPSANQCKASTYMDGGDQCAFCGMWTVIH